MLAEETKRMKVWNTFFKLAREQAVSLKKLQKPSWEPTQHSFLGGTLNDDQTCCLALIAWCYLAVEARVNHLIEELRDKTYLSTEESEAVRFLRTEQKWALLPKLAGKGTAIDFSKQPHQSIKQLCSLRNALFHVNYDRMLDQLPTCKTALSYFNNFVAAMEDMNVVLGRHSKPDPEVLKIALR